MTLDGVRRPRGGRVAEPAPPSTPAPSTAAATPSAPATVRGASAGSVDAFDAARDMRTRVGAVAVHGPTQTATPKLLEGWRESLLQAAAEDRADDEVIAPVLAPALQAAEAQKGEALSRREARGVERDVRQQLQQPWDDAYRAHLTDITRSSSTKKQTERDVVLEQRARIAQLKDPFTPLIADAPGARDHEIVLWESKQSIVVVDTFAPSPKALVVPKAPASLPIDLSAAALDELAVVAAHVSDAFMRSTGAPAAGIWVNPPQHLTVKQLHVHVLPDLGAYTADGAPAKALLDDATLRPPLVAWFDAIRDDLAQKLGPATR